MNRTVEGESDGIAPAFTGTSRFRDLRRIGAGACGTVYDAFDSERGVRVALKTLARIEPEALYRFKREFRSMVGIRSPHLVRLYDLAVNGNVWFFTMELLDGEDILSFVRPGGACDYRRLRDAFDQLCRGVNALHAARILHRDIKPSNILVTRQGRVVLADFGIVGELREIDSRPVDLLAMVGTPAYMAPEQGLGEPVSFASDWYSVGVTLFEAMTGRLPFQGEGLGVLVEKASAEAPRASSLCPDVPDDLDALCAELLSPEQSERPDSDSIAARFGVTGSPSRPVAAGVEPLPNERADAFIGRQDALASLKAAFDDAVGGASIVAHVRGPSGVGKTALLEHFLTGLIAREAAVVLAGRCYEREAVPFKGVDGVIDALSRYLLELPEENVASLLPRDAHLLTKVFPVLAEVPAFALAPARARKRDGDPEGLRERAFEALRELFGRLSDRLPLVLYVDDAQWGDDDSAACFLRLVQEPEPPALLLILSYRNDVDLRSPLIRSRELHVSRGADEPSPLREIDVGVLSKREASELIASLLDIPVTEPIVSTLAQESGGSPFFASALARHVRGRPTLASEAPKLATLLQDGFDALAAPARRLLESVSVAGRPLDRALAASAAGLDAAELAEALDTLQSSHFLRTVSLGEGEQYATFHDRIRETMIATLSAEQTVACHSGLLAALLRTGEVEPEPLYVHSLGAGRHKDAAEYALRAADAANEKLAFEHAASLYKAVIDLRGDELGTLREARAEALAAAGRGGDAAEDYLLAAAKKEGSERSALHGKAAEQFLVSGRIEQGKALLVEVLTQVGVSFPTNNVRLLAELMALRCAIRIRGFDRVVRRTSPPSKDELTRIDACYAAMRVLGPIDTMLGAYLGAHFTWRSLQLGEPVRMSRAILGEAAYMSLGGDAAGSKVEALLRRSTAIDVGEDRSEVDAMEKMVEAMNHTYSGRWSFGQTACELSLAAFSQRHKSWDRYYGLNYVRNIQGICLFNGGRLMDVSRLLARWRSDAVARRDLYAEAGICTSDVSLGWLINDDPDGLCTSIERAIANLPARGIQAPHVGATLHLSFADIYSGRPEAAVARCESHWREMRTTFYASMPFCRIRLWYAWGCSALAATNQDRPEPKLLSAAEKCAARLGQEKTGWSGVLQALLIAGVKRRRGDEASANEQSTRAVSLADHANMMFLANAARLRLGERVGGERGATLVDNAQCWLRGQGVKRPERLVTTFVP